MSLMTMKWKGWSQRILKQPPKAARLPKSGLFVAWSRSARRRCGAMRSRARGPSNQVRPRPTRKPAPESASFDLWAQTHMYAVRTVADQAPEKKPKAEPIYLAERGETDAGMKEILFWSLLLCVTHRGRVKELESWGKAVILEEPNVNGTWTPSAARWPKDPAFQASSIYSPLDHAHKRVAWTEGALDAVGLAMQGWRRVGVVRAMSMA